jgi:hypothetical protein
MVDSLDLNHETSQQNTATTNETLILRENLFPTKKYLLGGYPWEPEFQNSEYEEHQVGPKDFGSHNFSFRTLEVVGVTQISSYNGIGA